MAALIALSFRQRPGNDEVDMAYNEWKGGRWVRGNEVISMDKMGAQKQLDTQKKNLWALTLACATHKFVVDKELHHLELRQPVSVDYAKGLATTKPKHLVIAPQAVGADGKMAPCAWKVGEEELLAATLHNLETLVIGIDMTTADRVPMIGHNFLLKSAEIYDAKTMDIVARVTDGGKKMQISSSGGREAWVSALIKACMFEEIELDTPDMNAMGGHQRNKVTMILRKEYQGDKPLHLPGIYSDEIYIKAEAGVRYTAEGATFKHQFNLRNNEGKNPGLFVEGELPIDVDDRDVRAAMKGGEPEPVPEPVPAPARLSTPQRSVAPLGSAPGKGPAAALPSGAAGARAAGPAAPAETKSGAPTTTVSLAVLATALPQSCNLKDVEDGVRAALPPGVELVRDDAAPTAAMVWTISGSRVPWLELHNWLEEATKGMPRAANATLTCCAQARRVGSSSSIAGTRARIPPT